MSSTGGDWSASRSRGRSAKFDLIMTVRCHYQWSRSAIFELILTTRCQYWGDWSASRSRGRSAKFDLIMIISCQYWGIDLPADLGVDLPNLNSSWLWDFSTRGVDLPNLNFILTTICPVLAGCSSASRSRNRSAKFELILTMRCQYQGV